ncbi:large ribosomal subunit protein bL20 [Lepeophtheirus salmonis]|uniref:39S ribosomal protein L20, mitochondrial n=1 Tax=Lepeophtheirus salmonis TaxID=72036 RepID=C1BT06_LEPSM|nr:50S ribosomal protein L20-like [Lepeophtheirus salmonis]ACO12159.1 39S ribosomal protein L20, mitochondrial precursor [Lepeophtheirus salmonis]ADD38956.1 39S ribosomal protein L20, mitochondrial [Lepeophtheirus salmonis]
MFFTRPLLGRFMRFKDHTDPFFGKRLDFGKDTYWRRRKVLMLTSHYYGRRRNCFSIAIRGLLKAMQYVTKSGRLRTKNFKELSDSRIEGSSAELNYNAWNMRETLSRLNIGLNRKVIVNLAVYEPRSFRSIVDLCSHKESQPKSIGGMDITRSAGSHANVVDPNSRL